MSSQWPAPFTRHFVPITLQSLEAAGLHVLELFIEVNGCFTLSVKQNSFKALEHASASEPISFLVFQMNQAVYLAYAQFDALSEQGQPNTNTVGVIIFPIMLYTTDCSLPHWPSTKTDYKERID